jgi:pyruvate/2-oxoglutarate dehydrogenase complex dihydrolipoamide acyltransferase (E2) component
MRQAKGARVQRYLRLKKISHEMEEGILRWAISEGQEFFPGTVIYEIETDKCVNEVAMTRQGILIKILIPSETLVRHGEAIAVIDT